METGHAAEEPHGGLRMAAGEAVAGGLRAGGLHNGKVGILHPGAGHPADNFQPLVHQRPHKAHAQQVVPLPLVQTPENKQGSHHKKGLFPEMGHQGHEDIQHRIPDGLKPIQQLHITAPPWKSFPAPIIIRRRRRNKRKGGRSPPLFFAAELPAYGRLGRDRRIV